MYDVPSPFCKGAHQKATKIHSFCQVIFVFFQHYLYVTVHHRPVSQQKHRPSVRNYSCGLCWVYEVFWRKETSSCFFVPNLDVIVHTLTISLTHGDCSFHLSVIWSMNPFPFAIITAMDHSLGNRVICYV